MASFPKKVYIPDVATCIAFILCYAQLNNSGYPHPCSTRRLCSSRCILRALFLYNTCVPVCFFQRQQTKTLDLIHPDCEVCRMSLLNFLAEAITATLQLPVTELRFKPTAHTTVALVSWICFMFWTNSKQVITFLFFFFIYLTWPVVSVWQQLKRVRSSCNL